jgi:hypothetical protein
MHRSAPKGPQVDLPRTGSALSSVTSDSGHKNYSTTPSSTLMQVPLPAIAYTICVPRHLNYSRENIKNALPLCVEKVLHPLPASLPTI